MRILFLGLNYAPERIGIGAYSSGLCQDLAGLGHEVRVIAGKPYYPNWEVFDGYRGSWQRGVENGVDVTRCPIYVCSNPTGIRRIIHYASFVAASAFPVLWSAIRHRPDLVITVMPSLMSAPLAAIAARIARAKSWLHIQDYEVEAAIATGLVKPASRLARIATRVEHAIIRMFDRVSSISPEMCERLRDIGVAENKITEFRNWAEIDAIQPMTTASPFRTEWDIRTPHVALYSGNIGNKQGIEIIVDAARLLRHRADITFLICGDGSKREELQKYADGLDNVRFHGLQPMERLSDLLGLATIHLLPQSSHAADLVLPSKLTNMLASGRPVVATAAAGTGLAREVEGCGIVTSPGDAQAFASAIETLMADADRHREYSTAARTRAEKAWHRHNIIGTIEARLRAAVGGSAATAPPLRAPATDRSTSR